MNEIWAEDVAMQHKTDINTGDSRVNIIKSAGLKKVGRAYTNEQGDTLNDISRAGLEFLIEHRHYFEPENNLTNKLKADKVKPLKNAFKRLGFNTNFISNEIFAGVLDTRLEFATFKYKQVVTWTVRT